ncbi:serine protease [Spirochaetia bacterium]|nr:serine protease [Spirochaetia bacterium]
MEYPINDTVKILLHQRLVDLEQHLAADVLTFHGAIQDGSEASFLQLVEQLADDTNKKEALFVVLTTPGGSAIAVERYVNILRQHYKEVNFIVPDYAYSAGTIFCMSGDNIFMDYFSVLGPIDPQITNKEGRMVPALGYLDKINELIKKAQTNQLSQAEFIILKEFDLAELRAYEQAKELTIDLLKKWLVKYKFKNWNTHKSKKPVTQQEKIDRAKEIADKLSDSNLWKSHGRPINIETLENELKLRIEDFGKDLKLKGLIRNYHRLVSDFVSKNGINIFVHTRSFI